MNFSKKILSLTILASLAFSAFAQQPAPGQKTLSISESGSLAQPPAVARFLHNGKTFEKIFFNNFIEETARQKLNIKGTNVHYDKALSSIQLQQVTQIGVADIALINLAGFETNERTNVVNLFDYPFMFNDWNQIQTKFFSTAPMLNNQLLAGGNQSSPVAIIPASFRVIASTNQDSIYNQDISVENTPTNVATYAAFKNSGVRTISVGQTPNTPLVDVSVLDLYDQKLYQRYRNIYLTNHALQSYVLFVGNNWWGRLTVEQQSVLKNIFGKAVEKTLRDTIQYNEQVISALQKSKAINFVNFDKNQLKASFGKIHDNAPTEIQQLYNSIRK